MDQLLGHDRHLATLAEVEMDWNDIRHFLALARLGSARAASASLGVNHSTVARRVGSLKAQILDRNRGGYTPTEAGRQMLPDAERTERERAALERGLVGQDERLAGSVALTCSAPPGPGWRMRSADTCRCSAETAGPCLQPLVLKSHQMEPAGRP